MQADLSRLKTIPTGKKVKVNQKIFLANYLLKKSKKKIKISYEKNNLNTPSKNGIRLRS